MLLYYSLVRFRFDFITIPNEHLLRADDPRALPVRFRFDFITIPNPAVLDCLGCYLNDPRRVLGIFVFVNKFSSIGNKGDIIDSLLDPKVSHLVTKAVVIIDAQLNIVRAANSVCQNGEVID
jgi:hypothetical protein